MRRGITLRRKTLAERNPLMASNCRVAGFFRLPSAFFFFICCCAKILQAMEVALLCAEPWLGTTT